MKEELTQDLLVIISMKHDAPQDAEQAFAEFHARFNKYVWGTVNSLAQGSIQLRSNKTGIQDIHQDTFVTVWNKAAAFIPKEGDVDKQVKLWLAGIVRNRYKRWNGAIASHRKYLDYVEEVEEDSIFIDPGSEVEVSIEVKKLIKVMETVLNDQERDILLTWFTYCAIDEKQRAFIPKDIRMDLCRLHNLKPDSLRKVKDRAVEKLKKVLVPAVAGSFEFEKKT